MTKIVTDNSGVLSRLLEERSKLIQENAKLTLANKELTEQLILHSVGKQRELLLAYAEYHNNKFEYEKIYDVMVDEYLKSR